MVPRETRSNSDRSTFSIFWLEPCAPEMKSLELPKPAKIRLLEVFARHPRSVLSKSHLMERLFSYVFP